MLSDEKNLKYIINKENNKIEIDPNNKPYIIVNGEEKDTGGKKSVKIIEFLIKNKDGFKSRKEIIAHVWGEDSLPKTTDEALTTAVTRANKALAGICRIEGERHQGYRLRAEVTRVKPVMLEDVIIHEKVPINKKTLMMCVAALVFFLFGALTLVKSEKLTQAPRYGVINVDSVFVRDNSISSPQLSPDGEYIAHRIAHQDTQDQSLAITHISTSKTIELAKMRYGDGFKWNKAGNKIVYQNSSNNDCQIRLIHLTTDKTVKSDELIAGCPIDGGAMTFAWFNAHQFYFNEVDKTVKTPGLLINQLYSFNIKTKQKTKELSTEREGGVGFHSLEYDNVANALYMLKINKEYTTDVYRYINGELTKIKTLGHLLKSYTIYDDQFIYVNNRNELVLNDLSNPALADHVLLPSMDTPIAAPNVINGKIVYLAGDVFSYALHKLNNNEFDRVTLANFIPNQITNHDGSLVFTSRQTGVNQIHKQMANGKVKQLSDFDKDATIEYISVVGDLFAVSYVNRVKFYYLEQNKLVYANALHGYNNCVLADNGKTMLVTKVTQSKHYKSGNIVELQLKDFAPTGIVLEDANIAIYHQDAIIYVNKQQQLMQFYNGDHTVLNNSAVVANISLIAQSTDKLYYVTKDTKQLMAYDFTSGTTNHIKTGRLHPTPITTINQQVYIRTRKPKPPKVMLGQFLLKQAIN